MNGDRRGRTQLGGAASRGTATGVFAPPGSPRAVGRRGSPRLFGPTLREVAQEPIPATLRERHGNHAKAAELLGIGRNALWRKPKEYAPATAPTWCKPLLCGTTPRGGRAGGDNPSPR